MGVSKQIILHPSLYPFLILHLLHRVCRNLIVTVSDPVLHLERRTAMLVRFQSFSFIGLFVYGWMCLVMDCACHLLWSYKWRGEEGRSFDLIPFSGHTGSDGGGWKTEEQNATGSDQSVMLCLRQVGGKHRRGEGGGQDWNIQSPFVVAGVLSCAVPASL